MHNTNTWHDLVLGNDPENVKIKWILQFFQKRKKGSRCLKLYDIECKNCKSYLNENYSGSIAQKWT
jgi:hypothetical protein